MNKPTKAQIELINSLFAKGEMLTICGRMGHENPEDDFKIVAFFRAGWRGRAINSVQRVALERRPHGTALLESDCGRDVPVVFYKAPLHRSAA